MNPSVFSPTVTALVKRHSLVSPRNTLLVMFMAGALAGTPSYAQKLKPVEQAKVNTLKIRSDKAFQARTEAVFILQSYKAFFVSGDIQSGSDTNSATIYGTASKNSDFPGMGTLNKKSYLIVLNPADADLPGGGSVFQGSCTFIGATRGVNTYLSLNSQPKFVRAYNQKVKSERLMASIQAEINAVYLPYQKKAKNQAVAQAAKETRLAEVEADNQARVDQAREQLAKEKRALETAKQERLTQQAADAEIARLAEESTKLQAEKALFDAETQKQEKGEADRKAKELQETQAKNDAAIEALKKTPSIIAGQQLGSVRIGMSEAQVLQLMGTPDSTVRLRKPTRRQIGVNEYALWLPRKIRRDRYVLKPVEGLDVFYEGDARELKYFAEERGIEEVSAGDLKTHFIFDVFFLNGKVVQIESDSPQFFTADQKNVLSRYDLVTTYHSEDYTPPTNEFDKFITDYGISYRGSRAGKYVEGETAVQLGFLGVYNGYAATGQKGLSLCYEFLPAYGPALALVPTSRAKIIIHAPNTVPYTGDFQKGISLLNKSQSLLYGKRADADNVEERLDTADLNPSSTQSVVSDVVQPDRVKDDVKEKIKRGIGGILRRR